MANGVLLDTSFFIRLLKDGDPLQDRAEEYLRYFVAKKWPLFMSTLSLAEFCVKGSVEELPTRYVHIISFDPLSAQISGSLFGHEMPHLKNVANESRAAMKIDTFLMGHAESDSRIGYFLSTDERLVASYHRLHSNGLVHFQFVPMTQSPHAVFEGTLDFEP